MTVEANKRIETSRIHCLFTVIHCSFANDGFLPLLHAIDGEAVARNYPLFVPPIRKNSLLNSLFLTAYPEAEAIPTFAKMTQQSLLLSAMWAY
jgi:hypothetical protein